MQNEVESYESSSGPLGLGSVTSDCISFGMRGARTNGGVLRNVTSLILDVNQDYSNPSPKAISNTMRHEKVLQRLIVGHTAHAVYVRVANQGCLAFYCHPAGSFYQTLILAVEEFPPLGGSALWWTNTVAPRLRDVLN